MPALNEDWFIGALDRAQVVRALVRLMVAVVLGGVIGLDRQFRGKDSGLRTHMLVALGGALFTLASVEIGMQVRDLSRVIQGVAAGVGFLGAGTILKIGERRLVIGLTTAAALWLTAAVGMAVGLGLLWPAALAVALCWIILTLFQLLEWLFPGPKAGPGHNGEENP